MTIRVALADDQVLVRAGFSSLLEHAEGIEVIGAVSDGRQAVDLARRTKPDLILMDIRMPVLDGIEATRQICEDPRLDGIRVVVLTTFELDEYVFAALWAGASGFLLKDIEPEDLRKAVRIVAEGECLLSPSITRRLIAAFTARPGPTPTHNAILDLLTEREKEITTLVAHGLSNREIAERLLISAATAKTHIARAMGKVCARDRAQLVVFAYQSGLVYAPPAG